MSSAFKGLGTLLDFKKSEKKIPKLFVVILEMQGFAKTLRDFSFY
jgi:hypothetical protein